MKIYFTWLDLVAPIGVATLAILLCTWAIVRAKNIKPRIVSGITALVFIASIPGWYYVRAMGLIPDYTTSQGVDVVQGNTHLCTEDFNEEAIGWTAKFWIEHQPKWCIAKGLKATTIICHDQKEISIYKKMFLGYATNKVAIVCNLSTVKARRYILIHELSHNILIHCGVPFGDNYGDEHHKIFEETSLSLKSNH